MVIYEDIVWPHLGLECWWMCFDLVYTWDWWGWVQ